MIKDIAHTASLHTYLEPDNKKFYIKLSPSVLNNAVPERSGFPFLIINESDPIASLIEAQVVSDAGSEVKRVFLLIQRDKYLIKEDELRPLNNRDVNESWQKAFSFYAKQSHDGSFILLSDQINKEGGLSALSSLFYCKTRKIFFIPPCPECGLPLKQCEDDTLLKSSGLQPFSGSLNRYLYCPVCSLSDSLNFYVKESEQSDPLIIKDQWALIKEFGLLREVNKEITAFPCNDCQLHQECYGPDNSVITRIVPFSFYPFYMFIFEAMSLNALDFISLLSGAAFEEVEALLEDKREFGRISCLKAIKQDCMAGTPFLFNHDERYFLEVLYLKLSFLGEVFQKLQSGNSMFVHPDLRLSADQIWIRLPGQGGLLPFYWNFSVGFMDINSYQAVPLLFQKPAAGSLFFSGLFWSYTLLVNSKQKMQDISSALGKLIFSESSVSSEQLVNESIFLPANIFWEPDGKNINNEWRPVWEKSVSLGWSLLKAGYQNDAAWNEKEFQQDLEDLRIEVREKLFQKEIAYSIPVLPVVDKTANSAEDEGIHKILMGIMNRMQPPDQVKPVQVKPVTEEYKDEEFRETVIISPQRQEKVVIKEPQEETETITPMGAGGAAGGAEKEEDMEKTVILSSKDLEQKPPPPPLQSTVKPDEDFLAETVILKPGEKGKK